MWFITRLKLTNSNWKPPPSSHYYKPRLVHLLPHFWKTFLCFQWDFYENSALGIQKRFVIKRRLWWRINPKKICCMLLIETLKGKIYYFLNSNMCFCSRLYGSGNKHFNVTVRLTKIMSNLLEHLKILIFKVIFQCWKLIKSFQIFFLWRILV